MGLREARSRAIAEGEAVKEQKALEQQIGAEHAAGRPERDASWDGQQWDYKTVVLTGGFLGHKKEELDRSTFNAQLDSLGAQGFELTWVLLEQALHGEKDGHVLIFKRPV